MGRSLCLSLLFVEFAFFVLELGALSTNANDDHFRYVKLGDINIGAILSVHTSRRVYECVGEMHDFDFIRNTEALKYAVEEINSRDDILPGISLGFVILDDCFSTSIALQRAMQFMPGSVRKAETCPVKTCTGTDTEQGCTNLTKENKNILQFYDVVGVIGPYTSQLSIIVSNVLNIFQIPQISPTATSEQLSNKERYPYFFRMVPPDEYQVKVLSNLLQFFHWTYVSVVYSEGSYGRAGANGLTKELKSIYKNICIEETIEIAYRSDQDAFVSVIKSLGKQSRAKVIILYLEIEDVPLLIQAIRLTNRENDFIWIGSDALSLIIEKNPAHYCKILQGSLAIQPSRGKFPKFDAYFESLKGVGTNLTDNPWLLPFLTNSSTDSWVHDIITKRSSDHVYHDLGNKYSDSSADEAPPIIQSAYAFAYALDALVKEDCSGILNQTRECIKTTRLYQKLKEIKFNGSFGEVEFNEFGDVMGRYGIRQCINDGTESNYAVVGTWHMADENLNIDVDKMFWKQDNVPKSECAEPCSSRLGTIYFFTKQTCCWECITCKVNEIVVANATHCQTCNEFFWPDEETRSYCLEIQAHHLDFKDAVSLGLCAAAAIGLCVCALVGFLLIRYKHEHVIRCTSVELSVIILIGTSLAFALIVSFLAPPHNYKCYINHIGFSCTFTMVYAPLLVKTNRIYRIFKAGKRTTRKPVLTSQTSQIFITALLMVFQVIIVIISTSLGPPEVKKRMPVRTEKFVELFCNLPLAGLLSSLCYNLVLVLICTFYAFKTRKLPDNYKESRYIAFCVDTTLLIWLTFLPTYFTTSRADSKVTILAVALLLNASVTLICLFIPRMYSLYKQLRNPCTPGGHHYKDFRIVKHVVTRNRSSRECEVKAGTCVLSDRTSSATFLPDKNNMNLRVSSSATIISESASNYFTDVTVSLPIPEPDESSPQNEITFRHSPETETETTPLNITDTIAVPPTPMSNSEL